jgi:hypothetical protein
MRDYGGAFEAVFIAFDCELEDDLEELMRQT